MSRSSEPRGTLYVVGTPIGNLDDLSPRAVHVFAESELVACEDTRRTATILARHGLSTRMISYHKFNEARRLPEILRRLDRGERIALATDGGTPGISDPGALLVHAARRAGHRIIPVPGPSAVTALLSVAGLRTATFTFIGFPPHRKGERRRALEALRAEPRPLLFFESPQRLVATLGDVIEILGDRDAVLGREMTKIHEEFHAGPLSSIRAALSGLRVRGEVAFLVAGPGEDAPPAVAVVSAAGTGPAESPARRVRRLMESGVGRKEAMRRVARETGMSRRDVYSALLRDRTDAEE